MGDWPRGRARDGGIDRIPLPVTTRGGLSLCGKHAVGVDPESALATSGASTIVCLNPTDELVDRYPAYVEWLTANQPHRAVWFPVPDLHAPSVDAARVLLDDLVLRLDDGQHLLVHCGAGIGRAGTVAICLLIALGVPQADALHTVASHRPMAGPEVGSQRDLVDAVAGLSRREHPPPR